MKPERVEFTIDDTLKENYEMEIVALKNEEYTYVTASCLYENTLYYAIDFQDYMDHMAMEAYENDEEMPQFEKEYNTQIRAYDIESGKDELIYQYDEDFCVMVSDMQCNGEILLWEDYEVEKSFRILKWSLQDAMEPVEIELDNVGSGCEYGISLTLYENTLYWYDYEKSDNQDDLKLSMYDLKKYDLTEEKVQVEKSDLSTTFGSEHITIFQDTLTTYSYDKETGSSNILVNNLKSGKTTTILVDGRTGCLKCNGRYCIWKPYLDEKTIDETVIYIYDIEKGEYKKTKVDNIFSYGFMENVVVINSDEGVWIYDMAENRCSDFVKADSYVCLTARQGTEGSLHMKYMDSTVENGVEKIAVFRVTK